MKLGLKSFSSPESARLSITRFLLAPVLPLQKTNVFGNLLTVLAASAGVAMVLGAIPAKGAVDAYIPNNGSNTVSVVNTKTNTVTKTISIGNGPFAVAVNALGTITIPGFSSPIALGIFIKP
jgi:YVTN family beta-propeller protein